MSRCAAEKKIRKKVIFLACGVILAENFRILCPPMISPNGWRYEILIKTKKFRLDEKMCNSKENFEKSYILNLSHRRFYYKGIRKRYKKMLNIPCGLVAGILVYTQAARVRFPSWRDFHILSIFEFFFYWVNSKQNASRFF